jgi:hypothetical protein
VSDSEPVIITTPSSQAHRDLVGDQLGGGAHRAEEAVLRARRPAGEQQAVERERAEGEEVEDADRDVDSVEPEPVLDVAERQDRERDDPGEDHDGGGDREEEGDRRLRPEHLLPGELDDVGEGLAQSDGADPVGAVAVLEAADQLALGHGQDRHDREDAEEDHQRLDDHHPGRLDVIDLRQRQAHRFVT